MNNYQDWLYNCDENSSNTWENNISSWINNPKIVFIDITKKQIVLNLNYDLEWFFESNYDKDKNKLLINFLPIIYMLDNEFIINHILKSIYATVSENNHKQILQEIMFRMNIANFIDKKYYSIPKLKYKINIEEFENIENDEIILHEYESQYNNCIRYLQESDFHINTKDSCINSHIRKIIFNMNLKTISKLLETLDVNYGYKESSSYLSQLEWNWDIDSQIQLLKIINRAIGSFAIENFGEFILNLSCKTHLPVWDILQLLENIQENNKNNNLTKPNRKKSKNSKQKKLLKKINLVKKNFEYSEIINIVSKNINLKELKKADGRLEYRWLCPFHQENTASFHIYNEWQMHCFGCQWTGNIIDYLQSINWRTLYQTVNSEYFANIK